MSGLSVSDFHEFFRALNGGHDPFPWQVRLAELVVTQGRWPAVLDLPTASGKTAVQEIAVFALAMDAGRPAHELRAPRRCFLVVDRRVVVDEAFDRARSIAGALEAASAGVLLEVADRLRNLGASQLPVAAAILRGGMYREDNWARSPAQPLLAVSTVDQVGSRLLFRGYGVTDRAKPIHAGLVGNDSLIILDEAHLSTPFDETLEAIQRYRRLCERPLPDRWQVVRMSATPGVTADFRLGEDDRDEQLTPVLAKRLSANKPAQLHRLDVDKLPIGDRKTNRPAWVKWDQAEPERRDSMARECANQAISVLRWSGGHAVMTVGVVVNRVDLARRIFTKLGDHPEFDATLLTGRSRPCDRDDLMSTLLPRIRAGRARDDAARPIIVVATQCIEAGANLDFDALVTECASFDALRQRFGRLDRLGQRRESPAVILVRSDHVERRADPDPVYGEALRSTWNWLMNGAASGAKKRRKGASSPATVDFGVNWLRLPDHEQLSQLIAPRSNAPVMLPAHLDAWAQTCPVPAPDPDVAYWLHGPGSGPADVQIVWRADLTESDLEPGAAETAVDTVSLCPPASGEALPVPLWAVRGWLRDDRQGEVSDAEGQRGVDGGWGSSRQTQAGQGHRALRWHGDESEVIGGEELRPGDTIVVPAGYGGADRFGWDPSATGPVPDLGDRVNFHQRGRPVLRLLPEVVAPWFEDPTVAPMAALVGAMPGAGQLDDPDTDIGAEVRDWLRTLRASNAASQWAREAASALLDRSFRVLRHPRERSRLVVVGKRPSAHAALPDFTSDDDSSVMTLEVPLDAHSDGVRERASSFARASGLPDSVSADLALAAWLHDVGKADPRLQLMLLGGDRVRAALADQPLAKSSVPQADRSLRRTLRERSGYPAGTRHELQSVALVQACEGFRKGAHDWDLVLHLIASHHGRCRPFAPVVQDRDPKVVNLRFAGHELSASSHHGLASLDSGVSDRFWALIERYGWFGLAWLEAIVRLADHRQSETEMG